MLYYDRIDVSEGIDLNKTSASKECDICYYWYFLDKRSTFELYFCNGFHDVLMMSDNLKNIAILNISCADNCCIINRYRKSDAINLLQSVDLTKVRGAL